MDENETQKDTSTVEVAAGETAEDSSQDLVKAELEKEKRSNDRTEPEKAAYSLKKNAERVAELGLDPAAILGIVQKNSDDEDAPVTVGMLKQMNAENAKKSALQLANDISNEHERELAKHYLNTRIVPSGDAQSDLRTALALVNSVKNGQILEEQGRRANASPGTGSGGPAKPPQSDAALTEIELSYMRPPFNLTKEQIIASRPK